MPDPQLENHAPNLPDQDISYAGLSVLNVDDQEFVRRIVTVMAEKIGFGTIETCEDGEQAINLLTDMKPDLIICDINMEPMDGLTFLSKVRQDFTGKVRATPFIILTGEISTALVTQASELRCDCFLLKPVAPQKLKERIDEIFKGESVQSEDD